MALKTLSALPVFADSLFADRFNRIDRLFSQLTGDTPVGTLRKVRISPRCEIIVL